MQIEAKLLITNVNQLYIDYSKKFILPHTTLEINLAQIISIDSAGLALLINLKSLAKKRECNLSYHDASAEVRKFCQLYSINLE
jgi:ABC-type transporter Mla MlaB component